MLNINITINNITLGFCGRVFVVGSGSGSGFYEKTPGVSPMSDRTNLSSLQNKPGAVKAEPISSAGGSFVRRHF